MIWLEDEYCSCITLVLEKMVEETRKGASNIHNLLDPISEIDDLNRKAEETQKQKVWSVTAKGACPEKVRHLGEPVKNKYDLGAKSEEIEEVEDKFLKVTKLHLLNHSPEQLLCFGANSRRFTISQGEIFHRENVTRGGIPRSSRNYELESPN